jgi:CDP-glycerol glycerophosphotransferase (TagB/SpsB family)
LRSGAEVVGRLLTIKGIRVLYRPHPNTGARDARFARAHEKVVTLLAEAGRPHATAEAATTDLHAAFNMADVLVTDITSLISDFLASGKPYVVVNSTDLSESAFRERFPSSAGAAVVDNDADGLEAAIIDALGPDTMREERERLREELIGPPTDDPVRGFAEAIDALGATLRPRSRSRGHGVAATRGAEG